MLGRRKMVGALLASAAAIGSGAGLAATHGSLHPAARPTRLPVAHRLGPSVHYPCHHPGGAAAKADLQPLPYDPTIYRGAAAHYRRGRPPYSPQLEPTLAAELDLDGSGRPLDGGCGPGILTVRAADERGIANIRWVRALAEELPGAAPGPYRVVTFGQALHWSDEARVAEAVYDLLEPGGALVPVVHTVEGRPVPPSPGPPPIPHAEIRALVENYLGPTRRARQGVAPVRAHRFEDVLVRTRFGMPRVVFAPGIPDLLRDAESVLSGYFSMSSSAPHLFGDRLEDFADEVRKLLGSRSPDGVFSDWPGDTEVILARRPRAEAASVS